MNAAEQQVLMASRLRSLGRRAEQMAVVGSILLAQAERQRSELDAARHLIEFANTPVAAARPDVEPGTAQFCTSLEQAGARPRGRLIAALPAGEKGS